ncbi:MAG: molybdopterin-binding protein [Candidatus Parvarchaeota archaeon]
MDAGVVGDSKVIIRDRVLSSLKSCDALIVTGGSGPGKHDLVAEVLEEIGKMLFHGIKIKPGRTASAYNVGGRFVLSLSGLPVAALVSAQAILWPFLELMIGYRKRTLVVRARTNDPINADPGIHTFARVKLSSDDHGYVCSPLKISGSGILSTLLESDGTVIIKESSEG